jgi:uncharacterized protein YjbJ (UPF0337 family)
MIRMTYDGVKGDLKEVTGKVQSKIGEATGDHKMEADGVVRDLAGQAQSLYGDIKSGVSDVADGLVDMASNRLGPDNAKALQDAVQKYPLVALALAAAAGFMLSSLTTR